MGDWRDSLGDRHWNAAPQAVSSNAPVEPTDRKPSESMSMTVDSHIKNEVAVAEQANDTCYTCGEVGHRKAECPDAESETCRYCKKAGHFVKDCPDKPPMVCNNCGQEGHLRKNCENARKVDRDGIAVTSPDDAWQKIKKGASERDMDDVKEGLQEYVKALGGEVTYRELQQAFIDSDINVWLIAMERTLLDIFTNMDLQGHQGKKYTISYRFSETPERPRENAGWPKTRAEILSRLDDAGEVVDGGVPKCRNCNHLGHIAKHCPEEVVARPEPHKTTCYNCGREGHRVRDCPEPRVDRFACRNCGKSGHKANECEEPPNLDNVECRKCNEKGHFAKDCPKAELIACRNCGLEGHIAKDCEKPRNMDNVTCRNCDKTGHFRKDCPEPTDWSKVQCANCQQYGHTRVRCKEVPIPELACTGFEKAEDVTAAGDSGWGHSDDDVHAGRISYTAGGW